MSENRNEDLGLRGELNSLLNKNQPSSSGGGLNRDKYISERNISAGSTNNSIEAKKKSKKVVVQIRLDDSELEILKAHLKTKGYDTYSTGLRGIIKKYMIDNSLI